MKISEIYKYAEDIGVLVFSTIHNGEVHSRVAHFNGYDDEGIYFRTMSNKPFGRQLKSTGKITVCGCSEQSVGHDEGGMPVFKPGYSFRLIGEVKNLNAEIIRQKSKTNEFLKVAAKDIEIYPNMAEGNFVIYKAKVEIFDYDFECEKRDHKILRKRMSFGGMSYNEAGPRITEKCVSCGKCKAICSFKAIKSDPYQILSERCDDCGSCINICPANAIELAKHF